MDIASVEGLDGLSIGRLAAELELSKSGVFAHFGSKQELQLAAIRAAGAMVNAAVVRPAQEENPPGLARLWALCSRWLDYSRRRVFPGGCFFINTNAEYDARPGPVRDALAEAERGWIGLLADTAAEAVEQGELAPGTDPEQLAFEIEALGRGANSRSLLLDEDEAYDRARSALLCRLHAAATAPDMLR